MWALPGDGANEGLLASEVDALVAVMDHEVAASRVSQRRLQRPLVVAHTHADLLVEVGRHRVLPPVHEAGEVRLDMHLGECSHLHDGGVAVRHPEQLVQHQAALRHFLLDTW